MGLARLDARDASHHVAGLLQDPHKNNRYWALDTLVKLQARQHAGDVWRFYERRDSPQAEAYAIAALVAFGEQGSVALALGQLTSSDYSACGQMCRYLVQSRARDVIPAVIEALNRDDIRRGHGTNSGIPRAMMSLLVRLDAMEAVPVLREYVGDATMSSLLRSRAATALGNLRAVAAVDDLLQLLVSDALRTRHDRAEVAVALARIGDKASWPILLDFVDNANNAKRSQVIAELNATLDPGLWEQIHRTNVQGQYVKHVGDTIESFNDESGIRIVLLHDHENNPNIIKSWPCVNTSVGQVPLLYGIQNIVESLGQLEHPGTTSPHTYLLRNGEVHILTVAEVAQWWRDNKLGN